MRKVTFLTLLVAMAAFSGAGSLFAGNARYTKTGPADLPTLKMAKFAAEDIEKGTLGITRKDVDVTLRGRVRQDWIGYDKVYTLRASNGDQLSAFRTKACIDFAATYGRQRFGRSAADALVRLTNYGYWKQEGFYQPFVPYDFGGDRTEREHGTLNLFSFVEEAWVDLHFGTFFDAYDNWFSFKNHPVSLKIGYFPYELGRGLSLGDFPMHIPYMGWDSFNYDHTRSNHPGILIHGYINKDISYDLYYSKREEISISRLYTWDRVHSNKTDGRSIYRGVAKDRELWAAKMDFKHDKRWGKFHVQPYLLYVDAPELQIEKKADSSARLGTVGMMVNYSKGQFSMNAEVAGQFGHQNVYGIDRNELVEKTDENGIQTIYHSHVFAGRPRDTTTNPGGVVGSSVCETLAPVNNSALKKNVDLFRNAGGVDPDTDAYSPAITKNGDEPLKSDNVSNLKSVIFDAVSGNFDLENVYNSNVTGNKRFRAPYRLDYRGFMAALDMKYEFSEVPVVIASTATYVSGDKYPFNCERNKRYKGFLPYGDYNYIGKYVISQIVLDARKLSRPVDISYRDQYAHNNIKDTSNLAFLGVGTTWRPFKDKKKLILRTNLLWFWSVAKLKKWDKAGSIPEDFVGDKSWGADRGTSNSTSKWDRNTETGECGIGWKSCDDASRMLGTELNFESQYRPVKNMIFLIQLGVFIPGQLYKDLDGQPNDRTRQGPQAAAGNRGLGHDPVWRGALSLDYRF